MLRLVVGGALHAHAIEAVSLPAGQHHVSIPEEYHPALHADEMEAEALPAGQHHVPIQEEHHLPLSGKPDWESKAPPTT